MACRALSVPASASPGVKENITTPVAALNINDASTGFAWQAIAGLRVPLSSSWDAGLKYRFTSAEGAKRISWAAPVLPKT